MATAPRRLLAAAVAMAFVVAAALLLWHWLPGPRQDAGATPAVSAIAPARSPAPAHERSGLPLPRLRATGALEEAAPAMPEGLAQDLQIFDGTQLKAELESIALSYPEVRVLEAVCSGLPCRAEVATASAEQLGAFSLAVHQRFQGHISARTQRVPGRPGDGGQPLMRTTFWVGTPPAAPP